MARAGLLASAAVIGFAPINTFKCADQHIHGKQDVNALLLAPLSTPQFAETQVRVGLPFDVLPIGLQVRCIFRQYRSRALRRKPTSCGLEQTAQQGLRPPDSE